MLALVTAVVTNAGEGIPGAYIPGICQVSPFVLSCVVVAYLSRLSGQRMSGLDRQLLTVTLGVDPLIVDVVHACGMRPAPVQPYR